MKLSDLVKPIVEVKKEVKPLFPWMLKTKEEIQQCLKDAKIEGQVDRDLVVTLTNPSLQLTNIFKKNWIKLIDGKLPFVFYELAERIHLNFSGLPADQILSDLRGFPKLVKSSKFEIRNCYLTSLEGIPRMISNNKTDKTIQISSMKYIKNLNFLQDDLYELEISNVSSIEGIPPSLEALSIGYDNVKEIVELCPNLRYLRIWDDEKIPLLSILKLKNIHTFRYPANKEVEQIIQYHIENGKNILKCQRELIQNGFKDYAKH